MERQRIISLIDGVIANRKGEVVEAMTESGVVLPVNPTNERIRNTIVKEIEGGNGHLTVNLGAVIDKMTEGSVEKKSNIAPVIGATLISTGASWLSGLFGGGGGDNKAAQQMAQAQAAADAKRQKEFQKQMAIAASQQAAGQIMDEVKSQDRKSRTQRTVLTLSLIGGALLIGTVVTILIVKKR